MELRPLGRVSLVLLVAYLQVVILGTAVTSTSAAVVPPTGGEIPQAPMEDKLEHVTANIPAPGSNVITSRKVILPGGNDKVATNHDIIPNESESHSSVGNSDKLSASATNSGSPSKMSRLYSGNDYFGLPSFQGSMSVMQRRRRRSSFMPNFNTNDQMVRPGEMELHANNERDRELIKLLAMLAASNANPPFGLGREQEFALIKNDEDDGFMEDEDTPLSLEYYGLKNPRQGNYYGSFPFEMPVKLAAEDSDGDWMDEPINLHSHFKSRRSNPVAMRMGFGAAPAPVDSHFRMLRSLQNGIGNYESYLTAVHPAASRRIMRKRNIVI